jgi:hypothetical protein
LLPEAHAWRSKYSGVPTKPIKKISEYTAKRLSTPGRDNLAHKKTQKDFMQDLQDPKNHHLQNLMKIFCLCHSSKKIHHEYHRQSIDNQISILNNSSKYKESFVQTPDALPSTPDRSKICEDGVDCNFLEEKTILEFTKKYGFSYQGSFQSLKSWESNSGSFNYSMKFPRDASNALCQPDLVQRV